MTKRGRIPLTVAQQKVRKWIVANQGLLSRIAKDCGVSEQFVSSVAYGRAVINPGHKVERKLRANGWVSPVNAPRG
jgi:hypothetical protein